MFGATQPAWLALPRRARKPRAPKPPKPPRLRQTPARGFTRAQIAQMTAADLLAHYGRLPPALPPAHPQPQSDPTKNRRRLGRPTAPILLQYNNIPPTGGPMRIIIAGAGIGGLTLALSLHQIGVTPIICEAVETIAPLGVGINVLPHAVRELCELGLEERLGAT
eukprot:gene52238-71235_t